MNEDDYLPGVGDGDGCDRLFVVSGCSGGGKSTLMAELARRGHRVFPEPGRQILREQALLGGDALPWANMEHFIEQCVIRSVHFHTLAKARDGTVFFDRCLIDAISALDGIGRPLPAGYRTAADRCRYAPVVFMTPPWEELFRSDSERRHAFAAAISEYERLLDAFPAHGYEPVILPKSPVRARADFIETELKRRRLGPTASR